MATKNPMEIVVTFHGPHGTWRTAYLSPRAAIDGILGMQKEGATVALVYERERQTYNRERFPELY